MTLVKAFKEKFWLLCIPNYSSRTKANLVNLHSFSTMPAVVLTPQLSTNVSPFELKPQQAGWMYSVKHNVFCATKCWFVIIFVSHTRIKTGIEQMHAWYHKFHLSLFHFYKDEIQKRLIICFTFILCLFVKFFNLYFIRTLNYMHITITLKKPRGYYNFIEIWIILTNIQILTVHRNKPKCRQNFWLKHSAAHKNF